MFVYDPKFEPKSNSTFLIENFKITRIKQVLHVYLNLTCLYFKIHVKALCEYIYKL